MSDAIIIRRRGRASEQEEQMPRRREGREAPLPPSLNLFTTTCRPNLDEGRGGEELHFATELSENSEYLLQYSDQVQVA